MKTSPKFTLVLATFMISQFAFAKDACPTNFAGACTTNDGDNVTCVDLLPNTLPAAEFETQCESQGSVFTAGACAVANLAGSCVLADDATHAESLVLRMYAPYQAEDVSMICTQATGRECQ